MIRGVVNSRLEAVVRLHVRGPSGKELEVDTILDSGFTSSLTLPALVISTLGLVRQSGSSALLADGSLRQFDIYAAEVFWADIWQPILVSGVGAEPLLGMRLVAGHKLAIEVVPDGLVEIVPLS